MNLALIKSKYGLFIKETRPNVFYVVEHVENDMRSLSRLHYVHSKPCKSFGVAMMELENIIKQLEKKVG